MAAVSGFITMGAAVVIAVALWRLAAVVERRRRDAQIQQLLGMFGPAVAAARDDPRQLLAWYPVARNSRRLFPAAFSELDGAFGGRFPFSKEQVESAHARWTSQWLAWERAHDAEFSLKSAQVEDEVARAGGHASPLQRTRLAALEQEKLERYQQRYEEYVKTSKALAAFVE